MIHQFLSGYGLGTALALFAVGGITAFINSVAAGGSSLSIPLMILLGFPPTLANGTNRLGILIGNISSVANLRKHGFLNAKVYWQLLPPTIIGALLGTMVAVSINDKAFTIIIAGVIVLVSVLSRLGTDPLGPPATSIPQRASFKAWVAFILLGIYGSFIQVGIGFFQIFTLRRYTGLDLVHVNALKNALTTSFLFISTFGFALAGKIVWGLALCMSAGAVVGGILGSKVQRRHGGRFVQKAVSWAGLALAATLVWDLLHSL